ncbi:MAG: NusG domain II-containing protein [Oscillospiraceae bacterium]|nr:NusG domain II-containing protein [Oscillospiraceae bacterium]MBQ6846335.1 NusG domain II-containing protein [Oscillospiraceae bacterium]MBQ7120410.1 NusG domain II-containing protein [Oscillospiraceae bacterium]
MKPRIGDFIIGIFIFLLAVGIWTYPHLKDDEAEKVCKISVNGEVVEEMPLSRDGEVKIEGCIVKVEKGEVFVTESTCPDKVCERTGKISKSGESIICVPNHISVEISGERANDIIAG